jgi:MoxR-like ATPase
VAKVVVGKEEVIEKLLVAVICRGHVLLEDLPGLGKTTMAKAVARSIGLEFKRIQFTPDLLPSDLTGVNYFHPREGEFRFRRGPLFAQVILADEINRATPRTQSALLEAMEERQITVDGETYKLKSPFIVLATQNPIEMAGTFPLPEAQMDRFFMRLSVGYPSPEEEERMLRRFGGDNPLDSLSPVVTPEQIDEMSAAASQVRVSKAVSDYMVALVDATRVHPNLIMGASPRATLSLYRGAQALALLRGRAYVLPDDVIQLSASILPHRVKLDGKQTLKGITQARVIEEIVNTLEVPAEPAEAI